MENKELAELKKSYEKLEESELENRLKPVNDLLELWQKKVESLFTDGKGKNIAEYKLVFHNWYQSRPSLFSVNHFIQIRNNQTKKWDFRTYACSASNSKELEFISDKIESLLPPNGFDGFKLLAKHGIRFSIEHITDGGIETTKLIENVIGKLKEVFFKV